MDDSLEHAGDGMGPAPVAPATVNPIAPTTVTPTAVAVAAPRPAINWGLMAFVVAGGALAVSLTSWYQHGRAIAALEASQLAIASGPAANAPVIDLTGASMLGSDGAVVTLVEFSDYECPFCIRHFQQTMPQILATYIKPGKIQYAFRDWPVDELHPQSIRAHEAAHCAMEQSRFWDLHPKLFGPPGSHSPEQLTTLARSIGLDMPTFNACIEAKQSDATIRANGKLATDFGATGTPAFFIGLRDRKTNKVTVLRGLAGAQPFDVFAKTIDEVLTLAAR
jgi:protein-disulfide isomerase